MPDTLGAGSVVVRTLRAMDAVHFLTADDAQELIAALQAEGYTVRLRENPVADARSRYLLDVEPFDDGVVAMVDVYGGWLPDEAG
jgi:hypothetical protein